MDSTRYHVETKVMLVGTSITGTALIYSATTVQPISFGLFGTQQPSNVLFGNSSGGSSLFGKSANATSLFGTHDTSGNVVFDTADKQPNNLMISNPTSECTNIVGTLDQKN